MPFGRLGNWIESYYQRKEAQAYGLDPFLRQVPRQRMSTNRRVMGWDDGNEGYMGDPRMQGVARDNILDFNPRRVYMSSALPGSRRVHRRTYW